MSVSEQPPGGVVYDITTTAALFVIGSHSRFKWPIKSKRLSSFVKRHRLFLLQAKKFLSRKVIFPPLCLSTCGSEIYVSVCSFQVACFMNHLTEGGRDRLVSVRLWQATHSQPTLLLPFTNIRHTSMACSWWRDREIHAMCAQ